MTVIGRLPLAEHVWWAASFAFLLLFCATSLMWMMDARLLDGASPWAKPLKFGISLSLHFATLALVTHYLGASWRNSQLFALLAIASVIAGTAEIAYIAFQAARLEASHFNTSTAFYAAMYALMAFGAVVIVAASGITGLAAAMDTHGAMPPPVRLAVAIGLIGGTILTLVTAFRLGGNMGHHIGIEPIGAARMTITGWSLTVGDLRPPHFFATHLIQAVPVAGIIAARLLPASLAVAAILLFALLWVGLTILLFQTALAGRPFPAAFGF